MGSRGRAVAGPAGFVALAPGPLAPRASPRCLRSTSAAPGLRFAWEMRLLAEFEAYGHLIDGELGPALDLGQFP